MPSLRGFGLLLTTEADHVERGVHHGRRLRGRAQRRLLRVALGKRAGLRLTLSRLRPVAVKVTEPGRSYELPVPVPADPWLQAARRLLMLWLLSVWVSAAIGPATGTSEDHHGNA